MFQSSSTCILKVMFTMASIKVTKRILFDTLYSLYVLEERFQTQP